MATHDEVKIKHPRRHNIVPTTFFAVGTARGDKIKSVKGKIKKQDTAPIAHAAVYFIPKPSGGDRYRWIMKFDTVPEGFYKLQVEGLDASSNVVCERMGCRFEVKAGEVRAAPDISYPNDGQNIIDERDYFVTYGTRDANPVTSAIVTLPDNSVISGEVSDLGTGFWSAQFDLSCLDPDVDPLILKVTNNAGQDRSRTICIVS